MVGASVYYLDKPPSAGVLMPAMTKVRPTVMLSVPLIIEKIYKGRIHPQLTGNPVIRGLYQIPLIRKRLHAAAGENFSPRSAQAPDLTIGAHSRPGSRALPQGGPVPLCDRIRADGDSPLVAGSAPDATKFRSTGFPVSGAG